MSVSVKQKSKKRSKDIKGKGYRIVGTINWIEESNNVPEGQIVFETTQTINQVKCDVDINITGKKKTMTLPETEKVFIIKAQDHVKVMTRKIGVAEGGNMGVVQIDL